MLSKEVHQQESSNLSSGHGFGMGIASINLVTLQPGTSQTRGSQIYHSLEEAGVIPAHLVGSLTWTMHTHIYIYVYTELSEQHKMFRTALISVMK